MRGCSPSVRRRRKVSPDRRYVSSLPFIRRDLVRFVLQCPYNLAIRFFSSSLKNEKPLWNSLSVFRRFSRHYFLANVRIISFISHLPPYTLADDFDFFRFYGGHIPPAKGHSLSFDPLPASNLYGQHEPNLPFPVIAAPLWSKPASLKPSVRSCTASRRRHPPVRARSRGTPVRGFHGVRAAGQRACIPFHIRISTFHQKPGDGDYSISPRRNKTFSPPRHLSPRIGPGRAVRRPSPLHGSDSVPQVVRYIQDNMVIRQTGPSFLLGGAPLRSSVFPSRCFKTLRFSGSSDDPSIGPARIFKPYENDCSNLFYKIHKIVYFFHR